MDQVEPESSAAIKREWSRREKDALARLGFRHLRRDVYRISLGDDWAGEVLLHKRAATGPALQVDFEPPGAVLNHLPTQRLMRELYGLGPRESDFIILPGGWYGVPSDESLKAITWHRPTNLAEIDAAVLEAVWMLEDDVLPWMRSKATMEALVSTLRIPQASPGMDARRLETVAAVSCLRGDKEEARAALRTLREEHMPTGIPLIDEPQERYCRALYAKLGEPGPS